MTLFVFEILCILFYGAASALGAFGLRRGHRRAARAAKGVYLTAVAAAFQQSSASSPSAPAGALLSGPDLVVLASPRCPRRRRRRWGCSVTRRPLAYLHRRLAPVVALLDPRVPVAAHPRPRGRRQHGLLPLAAARAPYRARVRRPGLLRHLGRIGCARLWYQRRLIDGPQRQGARAEHAGAGYARPHLALGGACGPCGAHRRHAHRVHAPGGALRGHGADRHRGQPGLSGAACGLSLATTAVWSVFCALSFLAPWAASARTRDASAIAGLAAAVLLIAVSAG